MSFTYLATGKEESKWKQKTIVLFYYLEILKEMVNGPLEHALSKVQGDDCTNKLSSNMQLRETNLSKKIRLLFMFFVYILKELIFLKI